MARETNNIIYQFEHKVQTRQFEADGLPDLREGYERVGLLLLSEMSSPTAWRRIFEEYELSRAKLNAIRKQPVFARQELEQDHQQTMSSRKIEFGLLLPIEVESDMANLKVAMPSVQPIPVPHYLLYLPTLIPRVPPELKMGTKWNGSVKVNCKGGEFDVGYAAELGRGKAGFEIAVKLDEKVLSVSSQEMTLGLKAAGGWTIGYHELGQIPSWLRGNFSTSARGAYISMRGKPMNVELVGHECKFDITQVPVTFDEKRLVLTAWQLK